MLLREAARVHQLNRLLRKWGLSPTYPGESPRLDAFKAPLGRLSGSARYALRKLVRPQLRDRPPIPGSF